MKRLRSSISRLSTGIYIALQMRDGAKLQTSGRKADIIDIISCKSLGKNVWEQADIDKFMVETTVKIHGRMAFLRNTNLSHLAQHLKSWCMKRGIC